MPSAMTSRAPTAGLSMTSPISPTAHPSNTARRASLKILSRNIDKVVLGNLLFRTWYYSPYPDSIIHGDDHPANYPSTKVNVNGVPEAAAEQYASSTSTSAATVARVPHTLCERLHVCPYCFRYTPKAGVYVQHLRLHSVTYDPHSPSERQGVNSPASPASDTSEDTSNWPVPGSAIKVYEHSGYTVWDVDGEREKLYCQNLSLFGKLFLEQKSVFFDTSGFHYFVLTYTPPPSASSPATTGTSKRGTGTARVSGRRRTSSTTAPGTTAAESANDIPMPKDITLHTRVLGFFSKEDLSWDSNNLACILVFPPYQHRNLGQLLMAVSYKLSGWEWEDSIIGGPEKPLSAMGRRSYLRFWSERVARFMMGQTADADGRRVFDHVRKRKKVGFSKEEMTVKEVGERTGMLSEDVVAALNEMGVLEVVPARKQKKRKSGDGEDGEEQVLSSMIVHRSKVLEWVEGRGVDLVSPVKEEGFLGEWALSEVDDEEEEEDEQQSESQESE